VRAWEPFRFFGFGRARGLANSEMIANGFG